MIFLAGFAVQPSAAKPRDLSEYPLRVQIFRADWHAGGYLGEGSGVANLIDGQTIHAIDFAYQCPTRFMNSVGNQAYVAKWKKPEKTIEIVGSQVGNQDKSDTCEFKVTLHDYVYDLQDGTLSTFTEEQYKVRVGAALPKTGAADDNLSHYPLRLSVLKIDWGPPLNGTRTASGRGNVVTPAGLSSVDFTGNCNATFPTTPADRYYPAQWIQEGSMMTVLLHGSGASGIALVCLLKTSVHTDIYVLDGSGAVKAVSQEEYRRTSSSSAPPLPEAASTGLPGPFTKASSPPANSETPASPSISPLSTPEPAFVDGISAARYEEAPGAYHYVYPCRVPTPPFAPSTSPVQPALCWPTYAGQILSATGAATNTPPVSGVLMVSGSTVHFIPGDAKAASPIPDTPSKEIAFRYDSGQVLAELRTQTGTYRFAFQAACIGCTPGSSPIDLGKRPQLEAEYREFQQSLTDFDTVYRRINGLASNWRFGVTPKNQPTLSDPPEAMGLYSELNHKFAGFCLEPARSCVQTYEKYQACKSADPQHDCGQAPSCSAFCALTKDAIREIGAGVCVAKSWDSATLFPDWTQVAVKMDAERAARPPVDLSKIKLTPAPPGPPLDFMGKPTQPDNPCSVESGYSSAMMTHVSQAIASHPSAIPPAPALIDGIWNVPAPKILVKTEPQYPAIAKAAHAQGVVVLQATISTEGMVEELKVVSGPALLQRAALDAVKNWQFSPYVVAGKAVEFTTKLGLNFTADAGGSPAPPNTASSPSH
jgi:TonB family protein